MEAKPPLVGHHSEWSHHPGEDLGCGGEAETQGSKLVGLLIPYEPEILPGLSVYGNLKIGVLEIDREHQSCGCRAASTVLGDSI